MEPWACNGRAADRRVAVVGHGVIGSRVAAEIASGAVPGAELVAVVVRTDRSGLPAPRADIREAVAVADLIVECAGQNALRDIAEPALRSGADLVVTSVGALLDDGGFVDRLPGFGPGRVVISHGAIGGLDLLASAARSGGLADVRLTTIKPPTSVVQEWMAADDRERIAAADAPVQVFSGSPREAARLFPQSLNVVAALALAVGDVPRVAVSLVADPAATLTVHELEASGPIGEYHFVIRNMPSVENPRTSGITPWSVLQTVATLTDRRVVTI